MHPNRRRLRRANHPGVSVKRDIYAKGPIEAQRDYRQAAATSAADATGTDGYANECRQLGNAASKQYEHEHDAE